MTKLTLFRLAGAVSIAAATLFAAVFSTTAMAGVSVGIYANVPGPAPYYAPPPPPVVYAPRVYYPQRPYYAPPPQVVYVQPGWERHDWRARREWRERQWRREQWEREHRRW